MPPQAPSSPRKSSKSVPFYGHRYHPQNKWWTFKKAHGRTNTRFGRFESGQFVTGALRCVCCFMLSHGYLFAANSSTPPQPAAVVAAVVVLLVSQVGAAKMLVAFAACYLMLAACTKFALSAL
jgi:hypothetical protein